VKLDTKQLLKSHNLRITPFREQVLELFMVNDSAISSRNIQDELKSADRITVYRTLKSFIEKGLVHEAFDGTDTPKYALCEDHCNEHAHHDQHVHFHCHSCDQTFCVEDVEVPYVSTPKGFKVSSTNIILKGECEGCNSIS